MTMKDQTELAPCPPKCPLCGGRMLPAFLDADLQNSSWLCDLKCCEMFGIPIRLCAINSRPDLRRIKELEELANGLSDTANARGSRIKELEEKVKELKSRTSKPWSDPL